MGRIGVVVVGGDPPHPSVRAMLPADPLVVVAADSGFDHAIGLGLHVDVLVGDLDSISAGGMSLAEATDAVTIERHRPDKDFTDTELAIAIALERGAQHLVGISGGGDRLDHQLGTLAAFAAAARRPGITVELWWRADHIAIVTGPMRHRVASLGFSRIDSRLGAIGSPPEDALPRAADGRQTKPTSADMIAGQAGESLVSLVPFGGPVSGVTTEGLRYPLTNATLAADSARGISNVVVEPAAFVEIATGVLLVVTPGALP